MTNATAGEKNVVGKRFSFTPWSEIHEQGAYVSTATGRLFRVPDAAIKPGHSPLIEIRGPEGEEMVCCLSANPYTPLEKLRQLAADVNIEPQF